MDTMDTETEKYRGFIQTYSKLLHPNHYQVLLCKRYLAGSMRGSMTLEMVEERLALMTDFIQVFETVDPGLSKWRGKMLYQVYKTKMFLNDIKHTRNEWTRSPSSRRSATTSPAWRRLSRVWSMSPRTPMSGAWRGRRGPASPRPETSSAWCR